LPQGRDLGWPYCNPDMDPNATAPGQTPTSAARPPFTRDIQTNADGTALNCAALPRIDRAFGAHSAPLGLAFWSVPGYGAGAIVGVHGSWNRVPPRAPEVSFFSYSAGEMGPQRTLVAGFQARTGARWGRPVAAVPGPDGALYVTDDEAGAVYRVAPPSSASPGAGQQEAAGAPPGAAPPQSSTGSLLHRAAACAVAGSLAVLCTL
jgi:glucose/arabinose dehydrogenase